MSANLPTHYAQQFATNVELLLQQKGSRLRGTVMEGQHVGEQASPVDQIGSLEMDDVTTRFADITRKDAPTDRRWVYPVSSDLAQLIDKFDELKIITDPKSKYVENATLAAGRRIDRHIIEAFFGDAKTGKNGSTTTSFPGSQVVAVNEGAGADVGLTVAKLRAARKKFKAKDVDLDVEQMYCALNATQEDNLLGETQIISVDYNSKPVLVDGKLRSFLGFEFKHTELLLSDSNSDHRIPAWVKSGMHLGIWGATITDVDRRKDLKGHPWQVYLYFTAGATRLEEEKVVEIRCDPN